MCKVSRLHWAMSNFNWKWPKWLIKLQFLWLFSRKKKNIILPKGLKYNFLNYITQSYSKHRNTYFKMSNCMFCSRCVFEIKEIESISGVVHLRRWLCNLNNSAVELLHCVNTAEYKPSSTSALSVHLHHITTISSSLYWI